MTYAELIRESYRLGDELIEKMEKKYPDEFVLFSMSGTREELEAEIKEKKKLIKQVDDGTYLLLNWVGNPSKYGKVKQKKKK